MEEGGGLEENILATVLSVLAYLRAFKLLVVAGIPGGPGKAKGRARKPRDSKKNREDPTSPSKSPWALEPLPWPPLDSIEILQTGLRQILK